MESTNLEPLALPTGDGAWLDWVNEGGLGRAYDNRAFTAWHQASPEEAG